MEHRTPDRTYTLADVLVTGDRATPSPGEAFEVLRTDPELTAERERSRACSTRRRTRRSALVAEMDLGEREVDGAVVDGCPMHPDVVSDDPGRCPTCGMKLIAEAARRGSRARCTRR